MSSAIDLGTRRRRGLSALFAALAVLAGAAGTAAAQPAPAPSGSGSLEVFSPRDYQVFQRRTRLRGEILLSGSVPVGADAVEARITGVSLEGDLPGRWEKVPFNPLTRAFNVALPASAGGWYALQLRAFAGSTEVASATVPHFGVGEVFLVAGQSNSTNSGGEGQLKVASGMVSTFDGSSWRIADDPQPGVHDRSTGGSPWPAFGDALYERLRVPVAVAVTGHGGTSITQWKKGDELFEWAMTRARQLGKLGFRAVLWHQGESDVQMTSEQYADGLGQIIKDFKASAGWEFPWVVAQVSYHNPQEPRFDSTRNAQKMLWDRGIAVEGPDTDALTGDLRDVGGKGIHFSPKGLTAHGRLWADKVIPLVEAGPANSSTDGR